MSEARACHGGGITRVFLADEDACARLGAALCPRRGGLVLYLHGELGAGKSTLARALLRELGVSGPIRSPTYTLLEPYSVADRRAVHLDLYRISDPEELSYLGLRDVDADDAIWLIEWPERGASGLPPADLDLCLEHADEGRWLEMKTCSPRGVALWSDILLSMPAAITMAQKCPSPEGEGPKAAEGSRL